MEGLCAQIHVNLRWRVFGRNRTGDLTDYYISWVPRSPPLSYGDGWITEKPLGPSIFMSLGLPYWVSLVCRERKRRTKWWLHQVIVWLLLLCVPWNNVVRVLENFFVYPAMAWWEETPGIFLFLEGLRVASESWMSASSSNNLFPPIWGTHSDQS